MKDINQDKIQKILVVMLGGIGNMILLLPALIALKSRYKHAQIHLMTGEPRVEEIIEAHHVVDHVQLLDRRFQTNPLKVIPFISQVRREKYDVALLSSSMNVSKGKFFAKCAGIPICVSEERQALIHEIDGNNQLVAFLGAQKASTTPELEIKNSDEQAALQFLHEHGIEDKDFLIGMHVGSGFKQTFKRWPKERFAELADKCAERFNAKIVLTGGLQESELIKEVASLMCKPSLAIAGQLAIRETAGVVERCHLFVSNDSGIAHIAAAVQTPLIVLFGETEVERIAPRGSNVHILRKKGSTKEAQKDLVKLIDVNDVFHKVEETLKHGT